VLKEEPVHNEFSHGADGLRTFAEAHKLGMIEGNSAFARETRVMPVKVLRGPGPQSYPVRERRAGTGVRILR